MIARILSGSGQIAIASLTSLDVDASINDEL